MTATTQTQGQSQPQVNSETQSADDRRLDLRSPDFKNDKVNLQFSWNKFSLTAGDGSSTELELSVSLWWLYVIDAITVLGMFFGLWLVPDLLRYF